MRNILFILCALTFSVSAFATKISIGTPGFNFSPADVTINVGDTVSFDVGAIHTATEVSSSTYGSNGTTPLPGGFNFGAGTEQLVTNLTVGVHYFVCQNHVGMGMKGTITVQTSSGVKMKSADNLLKIFPNPTSDYIYYDAKDIDIKKITITSIDGKISKEIVPGRNTARILISDLPDNSYIFTLYTKRDEVYTSEFVKE